MSDVNRRIVLASRPHGEPTPGHFRVERGAVPVPRDGEVLLRNRYLSLDPYMRGRMSAAKSYAKPVEINDVMVGATVAEVAASRNPDFAVGDTVLAYGGWQDFSVSNGQGLRRLDPAAAPVTTSLGVLGMPGMTAYTGLLTIGAPKPGETVVVAAATGPVGSLVGQIAKLKGARAVGIAGGADKCRFLTEELGFDAAVDHRSADLPAALAAACPDGIDVYFENVGGAVFDAVLPLLNDFARVPVCGLVAHYNMTELPPGPDRIPALMRATLSRRLTLRGFIVWDFAEQEPAFLRDVSGWLREGRIRYREDVVEGLESAPEAFIGLLKGRNFGKLVVKL
ncbi:NADPH-dependent curcumin reductase [Methylobacterium crusticola]|uniref:NADPH-dependent curcumin reductase n=1 Tax=Methylobacterium crusticola TaxID=1697972 RepID=A0ABQ4R3M7_9HYPH|nr:NADP-dependent oxidoreductase [Methylobacterium crusticola]GJD51454.1 NADPH-dependent curcumin reductase [Methylobacterium crusticola]